MLFSQIKVRGFIKSNIERLENESIKCYAVQNFASQ